MFGMKKTFLFVLASLLPLLSCSPRAQEEEQVDNLYSDAILSSKGRVRVVAPPGDIGMVNPFHTVVSGAVYSYSGTYDEEEIEALQEEFQFRVSYYSALSDRHYDYTLDGKPFSNLKTVNETERGTEVVLDPFLYDLLKESFLFSLETRDEQGMLRFDIFTGALNDLYEEKLSELEASALDKALSLANGGLTFSSDIDADRLEEALSRTPATYDECKNLLSFDDERKAVTFHPFYRDGKEVDGVEISLSGVAKGFATNEITKEFQSLYPEISLLISSGTSSIKAVGNRPDDKPWSIRLSNPVYQEARLVPERNPYEVAYRKKGPFSLSTSGFSENHFYVYEPGEESYIRRDHIVDPSTGYSTSVFDQVSVLLDDAGLADMYTTALMLTASVDEALSLKDHLDSVYQVESEALLLQKSSVEDADKLYRYSNLELSPLSASGLPIVLLSDGVRYEGDYSDVAASDIQESVSQAERDFRVTYHATESFFDALEKIEDKNSTPYPEHSLARIVEVA